MRTRLTRRLRTGLLAVACGASASACGGGGSLAAPAAPRPPASLPVAFTIALPNRGAAAERRRPRYVSASTKSAAVTVSAAGAAASAPAIIGCSASACSGTVSAPAGSDTFLVKLYDGANGTGNLLSTGSVTQTIALDAANHVSVTFDGVVASLGLGLAPARVPSGTPASVTVAVSARDADGNTIVGSGRYVDASGAPLDVALSDSDASGATKLSTKSASVPATPVTLTYDGASGIASATIGASAHGVTPVSAVLTIAAAAAAAHLYVANGDGNSITVYALNASGNAAPARTIAGASTHLAFPQGLAFDAAGNLLVAEGEGLDAEIDAFSPTANGDAAPLYTIVPGESSAFGFGLAVAPDGELAEAICGSCGFVGSPDAVQRYALGKNVASPTTKLAGGSTGLAFPYGLAFDASGTLYVADNLTNAIGVFPPGSAGDVAPSRTIAGGAVKSPTGLAVDASGELFASIATGTSAAILVFPKGGSSPARTIANPVADTFVNPSQILIDATGALWVPSGNVCGASTGAPCAATGAVSVYAPGAATPTRTIAGAATKLDTPLAVGVDATGAAYVLNRSSDSGTTAIARMGVYAPGASGNVAPLRTMTVPAGDQLAVTPDGTVVVIGGTGTIGSYSTQLNVYAPGSGGPAPTRTISPPAGAQFSMLLGVDALGDVYATAVAPGAPTDVLVYGPDAAGGPIRTIAVPLVSGFDGAVTGGTVAANGTVYVDAGNQQLSVYAPDANGNATPARTIPAQPGASLVEPVLAVDGSGEILSLFRNAIRVYPASATGTTPPSRVIPGASAGLNGNVGLAFDPSGDLVVANRFNDSVTVYAPGAGAPVRTLSGPATALLGPTFAVTGP